MHNKRVKIAPFGRWDAQKARALYPCRYVFGQMFRGVIFIAVLMPTDIPASWRENFRVMVYMGLGVSVYVFLVELKMLRPFRWLSIVGFTGGEQGALIRAKIFALGMMVVPIFVAYLGDLK